MWTGSGSLIELIEVVGTKCEMGKLGWGTVDRLVEMIREGEM